MSLFADLYKPVKDFFSKNYNTAPLRIEAKGTSPDGLILSPSVERAGANLVTAVDIEQAFGLGECATLNGKVSVGSAGRAKTELKLKNIKNLQGLEATGTLNMGMVDSTKDTVEVSAEYKKSKVGLSFLSNFSGNKFANQSLNGSLAYLINSTYAVGGAVAVSNATVQTVSVGAAYKTANGQISVNIDDQVTNENALVTRVGGIMNQPNVTFGAEAVIGNKKTNVALGLSTVVNTTLFKAKVNNQGIIGVSATHKLCANVTATLSAGVDTTKGNLTDVGAKFVWE